MALAVFVLSPAVGEYACYVWVAEVGVAQQALTRYLGGLPVVFYHGAFQFVVEVLYLLQFLRVSGTAVGKCHRLQVLFF